MCNNGVHLLVKRILKLYYVKNLAGVPTMDTSVVVTVGTETLTTTTDLPVHLLVRMKVSFYLRVNTLGHVI